MSLILDDSCGSGIIGYVAGVFAQQKRASASAKGGKTPYFEDPSVMLGVSAKGGVKTRG